MTVLVVQSTAGTSALNGTAPDPTNVPGNTWVAGGNMTRRSGGGVWIPSSASTYQQAAYNLATARQKIYATNIVTLDNAIYVRALLNKDASGSAPFGSGTGYALIIRPGIVLDLASWSGSSSPTTLAVSSSAVPSGAFTISQLTFEHLTSGTLNASVTIGATTYTATATVGSPLTGTWIGFANSSDVSGGISADLLQFEDAGVTYTYARPTSDITTQWTPSTPAAPHYSMIDEVTYNDADYIYATAAAQTDEVGLQAMSIPTAGTNVLVNYRVQGITGGGSVTVSLYCGATLVKTDTTRTVNNDAITPIYTMTVTPGDYSVVTNWSDMRLRFVSA